MLVGVLPQVGLQALSQVAPEDLEQVLEYRFAGPDKEGQHSQDGDLLLSGLKAQARHKAFFLVYHHVDGDTNQDLRCDIEQLVDDGASGGGNDLATIAASVFQQSAQGGKAAGGVGGRLCHGSLRLRQKAASVADLSRI